MVGKDQDHLKKIKIMAMIFKIKDPDQRSFIRILFRKGLGEWPLATDKRMCAIYSYLEYSSRQCTKIWYISTETSDNTEFIYR